MAATEKKVLIATDRFLDLLEVLTAAGLVHRVGTVVADQETSAARARVLNADPAAGDYGLVVRVIPSAGGGAGAATEATLLLVKADVDKLPADPAREGGNLALVAKDATLGTLDPAPAAYTVLDRLKQLGVKIDAQTKIGATETTLRQAVLALQNLPRRSQVAATLLHRS